MTDVETLLLKLIELPTTAHNKESFRDFATLLEEELAGSHVAIKPKNVGGKPSWYLYPTASHDPIKPRVLICAHLDVVPADESCFSPRVEDDKIIGRGAIDMKFAVALAICLVKEVAGYDKPVDLGVLITSDEEIGGTYGPPVWLDDGLKPEVAIVPDGGANWSLEVSAKGVYHFDIVSHGVSAHASRTYDGDNAFDYLLPALADLSKAFPYPKDSEEAVKTFSCNIGKISGGVGYNTVPHKAHAMIDIRFPATETIGSTRLKVAEALKDHPRVTIREDVLAEAVKIDIDNPHVKAFRKLAEKVIGKKIPTCDTLGSSDARYFASENIPTIVMLPDGGSAHEINEWISRKALAQYYEILKEFVALSR